LPRRKVLLDECVDRHLAAHISSHDVKTVHDMGWSGLSNGDLLRVAQEQFDVFITTDRNLSYQQNLSQFDLAVAVFRTQSNQLEDLVGLLPAFLEAVSDAKSGIAFIVTS